MDPIVKLRGKRMRHILIFLMAGLQQFVADGTVPIAEVELGPNLILRIPPFFTMCLLLLQIFCDNVVKVAVGLCSAGQRGLGWAIAKAARLFLSKLR